MPEEVKTFMIEDATIFWRNFEGKEGMYNQKGHRNFVVGLTEDVAAQMIKDGWNVKYPKADEEGDVGGPFIQVSVRFDIRPPRIVMITTNARTNITEDAVEVLDWADFETVDLICNGYDWDVNGKSGTKAYLKSMFVTIREDALERKYAINETER